MAHVKKEYLKANYIEDAMEKARESIKDVPVALWIGLINVIFSYLYLYLPENLIIVRDIGSINLEVALIVFSIASLVGIFLSIFKVKNSWTRYISILINLAAGIPWYLFIYILFVLAFS